MSTRQKKIAPDSMQALPTRAEVDANVKRIVAQAISDYDQRRSPAAVWLWPVRWLGAAARDCLYTFVGVFRHLWHTWRNR